MRKETYYTVEGLKKADGLRKYLGIRSLSALIEFLVTDYLRKNKIVLEKKDELK